MRSFDEWANNLAEHISSKNTNIICDEIVEDQTISRFSNHLASLSDPERAILLEHIISCSFIWKDVKFWSSVCCALRKEE